jgi:hypothetical protein
MLEHGVETGRGGVYLRLTPEQYRRPKTVKKAPGVDPRGFFGTPSGWCSTSTVQRSVISFQDGFNPESRDCRSTFSNPNPTPIQPQIPLLEMSLRLLGTL